MYRPEGDDMQKRVQEFIREYKMVDPGDRVIVAVSGGADSMCLLHLLERMKEELQAELRVVHVHHGLRGWEADRDAGFVEAAAERRKLPCLIVHRDVAEYAKDRGLSVEEAGRMVRYQILEEEAEKWGGAKIAVAHHQEDQAETILHNLFRGSGLKGLCGMAAVRGAVIRPLLCVGKNEILEYLHSQKLAYCEDSTNASEDYTRNRLRHRLIPEICKDINAGAVTHIINAGRMLSQAEQYLENQAEEIWKVYGKEKQCGNGMEDIWEWGIEAKVLRSQPEILRGYLVRKMIGLCTESVKDITFKHIETICGLAEKETGKRISLPYGAEARLEYGMIWINVVSKERNVQEGNGSYLVDQTDEKADIEAGVENKEVAWVEKSEETVVNTLKMSHFSYKKHQEIPENRYTKWFDYDTIKNTLSVRTRQTGDYITLKDEKRKTVKAYMIDEKIPRQERDKILLLAEGHHILWIVGYRISEYYKITEHTRQILQVQADGGEGHERYDSGIDSGGGSKQKDQ